MNTIKSLMLALLGIFLVLNVSAATFVATSWEDSTSSRVMNYGETAEFDVYASCANPSLTILIGLYNSAGDLIHTFKNEVIPNQGDGTVVINPVYQVTPSLYSLTGNYKVRVTYSDAVQSTTTSVITLTIVPSTPNVAPVITSTAVTQVNEGASYSYQVIATDANGNPLTYSLSNAPTWLTINSATGLISGTAPSVSANTTYISVEVTVSDGSLSSTQTFDLLVKNVIADTTAPVISIISPVDGTTYNNIIDFINFNITEENLQSCQIISGNTTINVPSCSQGLNTVAINASEGSNTWTVTASDASGNTASQTVTFTVDTSVPDTQAPLITVITPQARRYSSRDLTFEIITNELGTVEFSLDSGTRIRMNNPYDHVYSYSTTVSEGNHTVTFYATDASNNTGSKSVDFSVRVSSTTSHAGGFSRVNEPTEKSAEETEYLSQLGSNPTINLGEDNITTQAQEISPIQKFLLAIINFFKKLFGLK
jgi:hypothetical protein